MRGSSRNVMTSVRCRRLRFPRARPPLVLAMAHPPCLMYSHILSCSCLFSSHPRVYSILISSCNTHSMLYSGIVLYSQTEVDMDTTMTSTKVHILPDGRMRPRDTAEYVGISPKTLAIWR